MEIIKTLIIEDCPTGASFLNMQLKELGSSYNTQVATRLKDALVCLQANTFDVILLDLILPNGNGLEVFKRVFTEAKATPIIVVTSIDSQETKDGVMQAGAADFFLKWPELKTLEKSINRVLRLNVVEQKLAKAEQIIESVKELSNATKLNEPKG